MTNILKRLKETGSETERKMPSPVNLGQSRSFALSHVFNVRERNEHLPPTIMGFRIPPWQRPLIWTQSQDKRFIESIWRGIPIGTYTYNQVEDCREMDGLLIDGQQRMMAIQRYVDDAFSVFGYYWSEITRVDKRGFENRHFHAYVTNTTDEKYLREYYDLMNFGGTAHKDGQQAALFTALEAKG